MRVCSRVDENYGNESFILVTAFDIVTYDYFMINLNYVLFNDGVCAS